MKKLLNNSFLNQWSNKLYHPGEICVQPYHHVKFEINMCTTQYSNAGCKTAPNGFVLVFHCRRKEWLGIYSEKFQGNFRFSILLLLGIFFFYHSSKHCERRYNGRKKIFHDNSIDYIRHSETHFLGWNMVFHYSTGSPRTWKSRLLIRFRPEHLNMTRGNPKSWYR